MKWWLVAVAALVLTACGGSSHKEVIDNPYAERMKELSRTAVDAMQRERWLVAERLFDRALQAAQLANDPDLVGRAWYNLGVLHVAAGNEDKGEEALKRAISVAERHRLDTTLLRARMAQALLYQKQGKPAWKPDSLGSNVPLDLHLSLARLAQLQERYDVAHREYAVVLNRGGEDRGTILYKIEAHMGLALLAEQQKDIASARQEAGNVLRMSREVGAPRLAAHALLLNAKLEENEALKQDNLRDALAIYQALEDSRGQKDTLLQLQAIAESQGDSASAELWRSKLRELQGPEGQSDTHHSNGKGADQ